jgi:alpha-L-arabinofuranosidase
MIQVMNQRPIYRLAKPFVLAALLSCTLEADAQNNLSIYSDQLNNGFQDWGWATHNYSNIAPVHSGSDSVSVTISTVNYDGLQIYHPDFDSTPYTSLSFWVNGGAIGGQNLQVYGLLHLGTTNNFGMPSIPLGTLPADTWQHITIPLSSLNVASSANFTGFVIQSAIGAIQPTFYVDDIQLNANPPPPLVHIGVDAGQKLRAADARWFGLNTAIWDGYFDTTYTSNALKELGTQILRCPGGSLSDQYNWTLNTTVTNTWTWSTSFGNFVHVATNAGVQAIITVNYGTGTSNEAAAWVAYANAATTDSHGLGTDQYGANWLNSGYWASLRAAAPQGNNDPKDFLRLSRTAPFGFKYWEVGNENYGTWEYDSNTYPNDPYTYGVRAAGYIALMKQVDPTIKIGVPVVTGEDSNDNDYYSHPAYNPRTGTYHNGWTPVVLATLKSLGAMPDFLAYHVYPEYGTDSDAGLLQASGNWAGDAADLRQQISDYIGTTGTNTELFCTENNADADNGGKQSTSIVNGLYLADSLAQLMKTEFNSFIWWDLRNAQNTFGADFDSSLYGWRTYGDLGIIGNANTRYPTFFTFKLMQYFARPGDSVLSATSDLSQLTAYAARKADGALALLVINKDSSSTLNAQITLTNFAPWSTATARSFGIAQDEATRTNSVTPGAQDIATNSFAVAGTNFTATFLPYSLTLITFAPAAAQLQSALASAGQFVLQIQGQPGVSYVIQSSPDLVNWIPISTNLLTGSVLNLTNAISSVSPQQFWRAVWQP